MRNGLGTNIVLSDALLAGFASLLLVWLVAVSRIPLEPPKPGADIENKIFAISLMSTNPSDLSAVLNIEKHVGCIVFEKFKLNKKVHSRFLGIGLCDDETGMVAWPSSSTSIEGHPSIVFSIEDGLDLETVSTIVFLRDHTGVCSDNVLSDLSLTLILKDLKAGRVIKEFTLSRRNSFVSTISLNDNPTKSEDGRDLLVSQSLPEILEMHKSDLTPMSWETNAVAHWRHPIGLQYPLEHSTSNRQRSLVIPDSSLGVLFIDELPPALPEAYSILLANLLRELDLTVVREPIIVGSYGASAIEITESALRWKIFTSNNSALTTIEVPKSIEYLLHGVSTTDACSLAALSTMSGFTSRDHETGAFYQNPIIFFWPAN